jgi:hypothetical protein
MAELNIPNMSIFARYGLFDRMGDGFVTPPNRRQWSMDQLYSDWNSHGFFKDMRHLGALMVSYNYGDFFEYVPSVEHSNRHQIIALSFYMATCFANTNTPVHVTAPHENGGVFGAVFDKISNNEVRYVSDTGMNVHFKFDATLPANY